MKIQILIISFLVLISNFPAAYSEETGEEEASSGIGPGKAVTETSKTLGLKLSEKAIQTLSLHTSAIQSQNTHRLPSKAIVYFQDEAGIYREKDGWYKLIEVEIVSRAGVETTIKSSDLKPGDHLVIDGVPLLRVAELNAFGGAGEGHGH